jgi:hypothetical protein
MRLPVRSALRVIAIGALAAFSLPGVRAARAEADLVPPAKQLFAYDALPHAAPRRAQPAASCGAAASQVASARRSQAAREAAMQRIAAVVAGQPGGPAETLDGRGFAYPVRRDPSLELLRVQREAERLGRAGR